ncbi:MAG: hypothetical protein WAX07_01155 [Candidatus Altiarchaeia archaeon]|jgi:hypothetical protein
MDSFGTVREVRYVKRDHALMMLAAKIQRMFNVLYVDCANTFDPYILYRVTKDESVLDRVYVSRPFTIYQLRELVFGKLERAIQKLSAKVLLVSGPDAYELDSPFDKKEYDLLSERVAGRIKTLTVDYGLLMTVSYEDGSHGPDG